MIEEEKKNIEVREEEENIEVMEEENIKVMEE